MRLTKYLLAVLWFAGAYALVGAGQEVLAASLMLAHCFALLAALEETK